MLALIALVLAGVGARAQEELPWYRTEITVITPERWQQPVPPIPEPTTVTREDYLEYITRTWEKQREYWLERAGDPQVKRQYVLARREAFFYRVTGDEQRALNAMQFIRGSLGYWTEGPGVERGTGFNVLYPALQAWEWIEDCPALTDDDRETAKQWFLTIEAKAERFEYGAMNRSAGWAMARDILARKYPDLPGNDERLEYADTVWSEWWPFRDTAENAEGYNGLWLSYVIPWAEARGVEVWDDPEFERLCYRFLPQVTPIGVMTAYGDGPGFNSHPGHWMEVLEELAAGFDDGRFRWAAHRLFEWTVAREEAMEQWGNINYNVADALMAAWMVADDVIPAVMPETESTVTMRQDMEFVSRDERQRTMRHDRLREGEVPNKLILRTGWEPDASFAQVELCRPMGHGHGDAGGISAYVSQGSVLLSDTPYLVKDHRWHNCFTLEQWPQPEGRWRWRATEFAQMQTEVERFETSALGTYADLRITDYMQQPAAVRREIMMLGDAGIWIEDTVQASEQYHARFGPAFQTVAIYGERGPNWVNTCHVTVPVAFIWELQYMMQWPNRPWDLLVWFEPTGAGEMAIDDVTHDDTQYVVTDPLMNNFKWRVAWREEADLLPAQPRSFASVLVPHAPTPDASQIAAGIETMRGEDWSAVRVPDGESVVWAIRSDTGGSVQVGTVATDAELAMLRVSGGEVQAHWVVEATELTVGDETIFSAEAPTTACESR
jgi:hypothetical protein